MMKATMAALTTARMTRNMPIWRAEVAISLPTRMPSIWARVIDRQPLPAPDGFGHFVRRVAGREGHEHGIDVGVRALRGQHRIEQAGHAGTVQRRVGLGAAPALPDGVVVLQELGLLPSLSGMNTIGSPEDETIRLGEADDGVVIASDPEPVADSEPGAMSATAS